MATINLTPHTVTIRTEHGDIQFPPSGTVARVNTTSVPVESAYCPYPMARRQLGDVVGLPADPAGNRYIVSTMVFDAAQRQYDQLRNGPAELVDALRAVLDSLLVPDSGPDCFRSGPDPKVATALQALEESVKWVSDGYECDAKALREALATFKALAAQQQGQIEAVRRFIVA